MPQYPQHRLQTMNNAAKTIILTKIKPGTSVGIVEFNTKATVLSELVTITTEADRMTLISRLPAVADGFTSIGAGILLGLEVRVCISLSYQIGFIFPLKNILRIFHLPLLPLSLQNFIFQYDNRT